MLQILHKILALIIALAVMFSSMSFTVEKHVCMGEVTDVSFFNEAIGCGMEELVCDGDLNKIDLAKQTKCCDSIHELIPGNQSEQQAVNSLELNDLAMVFAYIYSYVDELDDNLIDKYVVHSSPPLVSLDIQVLYQTFLI